MRRVVLSGLAFVALAAGCTCGCSSGGSSPLRPDGLPSPLGRASIQQVEVRECPGYPVPCTTVPFGADGAVWLDPGQYWLRASWSNPKIKGRVVRLTTTANWPDAVLPPSSVTWLEGEWMGEFFVPGDHDSFAFRLPAGVVDPRLTLELEETGPDLPEATRDRRDVPLRIR